MSKLSREEKRRKKEEAKQAKAERKARQDAVKSDGSLLISMLIVLLVLVGIWNFAMVGVIGFSYTRAARERAAALSQSVPPAASQSTLSAPSGNSHGGATGISTPVNTPAEPAASPEETSAPEPTQEPPEATPDVPAPTQGPQDSAPASDTAGDSADSPAPSREPTQTSGGTPTQDLGPAVSAPPTAQVTEPPAQAPAQSGNAGTVQNSDGTYSHDFSGGRVLITTQSSNSNDPVYHTQDCQAARKIPPENEGWFDSAQAAVDDGRRLCGYCGR